MLKSITLPLLLALGLMPAQSQQLAPPRAAAAKIQLDVVVTPKSGGVTTAGLQPSDFTLLDNKTPQPINSVSLVDGVHTPVKTILVIDAVNTSYQQIAFERGEIDKFLHAGGGQLAHPVRIAVITDTGSQLLGGFSTDGNAISKTLDNYGIGLRDIRRSQGFYGATDRFRISTQALAALIQSANPAGGRTILVWISPGWPILSGPNVLLDNKQQNEIFASVVGLSTQMRESRVTLYSLNPLGVEENLARTSYYESFTKGISKPSDAQLGDLSVQTLALQTGGLALSSTGLSELLQRVSQDANSYYELSFTARPAEKPNEYHSIEVKVAAPGMVARTRQGYYAQP